ncbi:type II secretion system F family protein [Gordonia sp. zg691]|uniref:Type II secretion system F family protein n=1 Tax=Gordonia jinghuaiqii TaxID=2758710 RepID=A0A7D7R3J4_9ACTN|nr:type II secretion system F family protein [Gordonia jinghuaiqii]MBD0863276.1 type II secretion system F family protein [Gordonia jinghuaiqii]MCR5980211.1 type II secretion system protein F [Gordonia jinghuaiqii]QMT02032.1 type II secretion system F family protein [Gordonia jinghuaiqii]
MNWPAGIDATEIVVALGLLVVAVWIWPQPRWNLYRVIDPPPGPDRSPRWLGAGPPREDPFAVASAFDLFAVCLRAGLPVGTAASVVADRAPASLAGPLTRVADLLQLGADPDTAWSALLADSDTKGASSVDHLESLGAMARRTARAGSSLAGGLAELAEDVRRRAHDDSLAAAERAGVAISGPLGLCFLPAFICLGIVPVVVGLASTVLGSV